VVSFGGSRAGAGARRLPEVPPASSGRGPRPDDRASPRFLSAGIVSRALMRPGRRKIGTADAIRVRRGCPPRRRLPGNWRGYLTAKEDSDRGPGASCGSWDRETAPRSKADASADFRTPESDRPAGAGAPPRRPRAFLEEDREARCRKQASGSDRPGEERQGGFVSQAERVDSACRASDSSVLDRKETMAGACSFISVQPMQRMAGPHVQGGIEQTAPEFRRNLRSCFFRPGRSSAPGRTRSRSSSPWRRRERSPASEDGEGGQGELRISSAGSVSIGRSGDRLRSAQLAGTPTSRCAGRGSGSSSRSAMSPGAVGV